MKLIKVYPFVLLFILQLTFLDEALFAQDDVSNNDSATIVIENAVAAMGGREYLKSIRTIYTDMSLQTEGKEVHWINKQMLPNKNIFKVLSNYKTVFCRCFDGNKGFELLNSTKIEQEAEELKDKKKQKNIFAELDFLDKNLWTIEMAGNKKVNGEDCYRVKATTPNGTIKYLCYSKKKFYKLEEDVPKDIVKGTYKTTLFGGYRKYGKLVFYSTLQQDNTTIAKMDKLYTNEKVSGADFKIGRAHV